MQRAAIVFFTLLFLIPERAACGYRGKNARGYAYTEGAFVRFRLCILPYAGRKAIQLPWIIHSTTNAARAS
ncbi:MAG: hypothetical protein LBC99_09675 [Spirochaetota bacterium]|jgi:hypothetical protein|nr:hypothetical protein [Spirochaetota bacterium]